MNDQVQNGYKSMCSGMTFKNYNDNAVRLIIHSCDGTCEDGITLTLNHGQ